MEPEAQIWLWGGSAAQFIWPHRVMLPWGSQACAGRAMPNWGVWEDGPLERSVAKSQALTSWRIYTWPAGSFSPSGLSIVSKDHTWNKVVSHFLKGNFSYSRRPLVLYLWAESFLEFWPSLFLHSRPILPGWPGSSNMNSGVAVGPPSMALACQQQFWELGAGRAIGFLGISSKLMTGWDCTLL